MRELSVVRFAAILAASLFIVACGGEDSGSTTEDPGTKPPASPPAPKNNPPTINGEPLTSVTAETAYSFQPQAADADGDPLQFQVTNKPAWAVFDAATGRLSGTPGAADVGTYANVIVSVSDGKAATSLPAFSITVAQVQLGAATLSWQPPTENTDGSPITDLAGYRVRYGRDPAQLSEIQSIPNPGITTAVVENLARGTWYFSVSAYNRDGLESDPSNLAQTSVM